MSSFIKPEDLLDLYKEKGDDFCILIREEVPADPIRGFGAAFKEKHKKVRAVVTDRTTKLSFFQGDATAGELTAIVYPKDLAGIVNPTICLWNGKRYTIEENAPVISQGTIICRNFRLIPATKR